MAVMQIKLIITLLANYTGSRSNCFAGHTSDGLWKRIAWEQERRRGEAQLITLIMISRALCKSLREVDARPIFGHFANCPSICWRF